MSQTEREHRLFILCKKMFSHYTGQDILFAKEISQIEDEINAVTPEIKPKEPVKEKVNVSTEVKTNVIKPGKEATKPKDEEEDLPW